MGVKVALEFAHVKEALRVFATAGATQGQEHIKPFHKYVALRLVLEGGFLPDEITPHPPLVASGSGDVRSLRFAPEAETKSELTVFGGMKTKQIDVVVAKYGVGPVVAVSVKGTIKAYRNLVNRMEEAIGDSTNVHVMYPGLVYGFLHLLRANRADEGYDVKDVGITADGTASPMIQRYSLALAELTGRRFVRNDLTRYESVGVLLVENSPTRAGEIFEGFPTPGSPVRADMFFAQLFKTYDLRFPARADHLPAARRCAWDANSPVLRELRGEKDIALEEVLGYIPRISD